MLTDEQRKILDRADRFGMIYVTDKTICPGIHFCKEWDDLAVCDDSPEADACNCGRLTRAASEKGG